MRVLRILAALIFLPLVIAGGLFLMPPPVPPAPGVPGDLLIRNINIVDVKSGGIIAEQDILVRNGFITTVTDTRAAQPAPDVPVIDATGKYAIPGLWDMHTHSTKLAPQYLHPLFIANGVTAVREMWGCMSRPDSYIACREDRVRWNSTLREGSAATPRYPLHGSFQINGGNEVPEGYPEFFKVSSEEDAVKLVSYYSGSQVDFLKIYSELSPVTYRLLARAAAERNIALAGHRPLRVSLPELMRTGQKTVEHPRLFLLECYRGAAEFRASEDPLARYTMALRRDLVENQDGEACAELMESMAASDTAWVPTLQVLKMSSLAADPVFRADPRLKYIPWVIRAGMWSPDADNAARKADGPGDENTFRDMYYLARKHLLQADEAGIEVLIGTDAGDSYIFPGFSVHDELAEFVAAGIPPVRAIRKATLDAARFHELDGTYGSIEPGKSADMLLLNNNPLENIHATRSIDMLIFNGNYFDRLALDMLLDFVERQSKSVKFNLQLLTSLVRSPIVRVQFAD